MKPKQISPELRLEVLEILDALQRTRHLSQPSTAQRIVRDCLTTLEHMVEYGDHESLASLGALRSDQEVRA